MVSARSRVLALRRDCIPQESAAFMNAIQKVAIEQTRLGIPIMVHEESTGGFCQRDATVFPQGIGLAATWNPPLVKQVAEVIREQMLAVGARQALAPVLDVARDPRWGAGRGELRRESGAEWYHWHGICPGLCRAMICATALPRRASTFLVTPCRRVDVTGICAVGSTRTARGLRRTVRGGDS